MKIDQTELQQYNDEVKNITTLINDIIDDIADYHKDNNNPYTDDKFIKYDDFYTSTNNSYFLNINNDGNYTLDLNRIKKSLIDNFIDTYGWVEVLNVEQMGVKIYNYYKKIYDEYIELLDESDFDEVAKYDVDELDLIFERIDELDKIISYVSYTNDNVEFIKTII